LKIYRISNAVGADWTDIKLVRAQDIDALLRQERIDRDAIRIKNMALLDMENRIRLHRCKRQAVSTGLPSPEDEEEDEDNGMMDI